MTELSAWSGVQLLPSSYEREAVFTHWGRQRGRWSGSLMQGAPMVMRTTGLYLEYHLVHPMWAFLILSGLSAIEITCVKEIPKLDTQNPGEEEFCKLDIDDGIFISVIMTYMVPRDQHPQSLLAPSKTNIYQEITNHVNTAKNTSWKKNFRS